MILSVLKKFYLLAMISLIVSCGNKTNEQNKEYDLFSEWVNDAEGEIKAFDFSAGSATDSWNKPWTMTVKTSKGTHFAYVTFIGEQSSGNYELYNIPDVANDAGTYRKDKEHLIMCGLKSGCMNFTNKGSISLNK